MSTQRSHGERDGATPSRRRRLPRWESFPPAERQHLVSLLVQIARRQVAGHAAARVHAGRG